MLQGCFKQFCKVVAERNGQAYQYQPIPVGSTRVALVVTTGPVSSLCSFVVHRRATSVLHQRATSVLIVIVLMIFCFRIY
jgi:hypothetical protein